jgi:7-cyano-7-deazaguanine synthase in queuosine biosynthesis
MSRRVVVWSGCADSTYLLHWYATYSSIQNPVYAITVDYHPQLDKKFMAAQRAAKFEMEKKNPRSPFF